MSALILGYLLTLIFAVRTRAPSVGVREAVLVASLCLGLTIVLLTEALGAMRLLTGPLVAVCWLVLAVGGLAVVRPWQRAARPLWTLKSVPNPAVIVTLVVLAATLVVALRAPPNAIDGHLYHLPRVMHWVQNESVAFYPTHLPRQLHLPPFAEYVMLHLVLLQGDDGLVNLVQWCALVGSAVAVSLIARELGADGRGQWLAALLAVTLPIAVVQAAGPKNDIVVAFWCVCLAWLLVRSGLRPSPGLGVLGGLAAGLAMLTKTSAAFAALPLFVAFGIAAVWHRPAAWPRLLGMAVAVMGLVLAINAPHAVRTMQVFGSPFGPEQDGPTPEFGYRMREMTPAHIASNALRAIAVNLGTPWEPVNQGIAGAVRAWHTWAAVGASDPRTTFGNAEFTVPGARNQDEYTGNPLHTLLVGGVLAALAIGTLRRRPVPPPWYTLALTAAFAVFVATAAWQFAHTRFLLPHYFLWCPVLALMLARVPRGVVHGLTILLAVGAAHALADHRSRPLLGEGDIFSTDREALYFARRPGIMGQYRHAAEFVEARGCGEVGIRIGWNEMEYPWWRLLPRAAGANGRIEHVEVRNVSRVVPFPNPQPFVPCAIITTDYAPAERIELTGVGFVAIHANWYTSVYVPEGQAPGVKVPFSASYTLTLPEIWQPGETRRYEVAVRNTGTEPWTPDGTFALRVVNQGRPNEARELPVSRPVGPGETITFNAVSTAADRGGSYVLRHLMTKREHSDFPQVHEMSITVPGPEPSPTERPRRERRAR